MKMISAWEKCLEQITPFDASQKQKAQDILDNDSLMEVLLYAKECGCFVSDAHFIVTHYMAYEYESGDSNYSE